jgi:hypothetical protein
VPVEVHVIRLGDMAIVTNPFELYLGFGSRMKARSKAVQTFVVQLAGSGSYVPTERSVAGGAYGPIPESTEVGPEAHRSTRTRPSVKPSRQAAAGAKAWGPERVPASHPRGFGFFLARQADGHDPTLSHFVFCQLLIVPLSPHFGQCQWTGSL